MRIPWPGTRKKTEDAILTAIRDIRADMEAGASSESSADRIGAELASLTQRVDADRTATNELGHRVEQLATALAHGIEHEDRRERRIEAVVRRARKQLAQAGVEDAGLEAEFDGLHVVDGGGGGGGELPAVREEVEESPGDEASTVAGVSVSQLQRARGF